MSSWNRGYDEYDGGSEYVSSDGQTPKEMQLILVEAVCLCLFFFLVLVDVACNSGSVSPSKRHQTRVFLSCFFCNDIFLFSSIWSEVFGNLDLMPGSRSGGITIIIPRGKDT